MYVRTVPKGQQQLVDTNPDAPAPPALLAFRDATHHQRTDPTMHEDERCTQAPVGESPSHAASESILLHIPA